MFLTEIVPPSMSRVDVETDSEATRSWVDHRYAVAADEHFRLNMITSLTGSAVGDDASSETLTGGADRLLLSAIRRASDVVVVGAGSVRTEGYVVPSTTRLAVVTASGDLRGLRPARAGQTQPVLVLCERGVARSIRIDRDDIPLKIVELPSSQLDVVAVRDALHHRGLRRIVCEGGPTLAAAFATAGLIDEYCVTVAPTLTPASMALLPVAHTVPTTARGLLADSEGFSYLRLQAQRSTPAH